MSMTWCGVVWFGVAGWDGYCIRGREVWLVDGMEEVWTVLPSVKRVLAGGGGFVIDG